MVGSDHFLYSHINHLDVMLIVSNYYFPCPNKIKTKITLIYHDMFTQIPSIHIYDPFWNQQNIYFIQYKLIMKGSCFLVILRYNIFPKIFCKTIRENAKILTDYKFKSDTLGHILLKRRK